MLVRIMMVAPWASHNPWNVPRITVLVLPGEKRGYVPRPWMVIFIGPQRTNSSLDSMMGSSPAYLATTGGSSVQRNKIIDKLINGSYSNECTEFCENTRCSKQRGLLTWNQDQRLTHRLVFFQPGWCSLPKDRFG